MTKIALCDARGPLNDLNDKLAGENGEVWLEALKRCLRKENPWAAENWPVWMEVEIGRYDGPEAYIATLEAAGIKVSDWAKDLLRQMPISPIVRKVKLVRIKVSDLGFTDWTTLRDIYVRAASRDLDLCPAEVGPTVRLADPDQKPGKWYLTALEAISGAGGVLRAFSGSEDGRWLLADYGGPVSRLLHPDRSVVFCLPEP